MGRVETAGQERTFHIYRELIEKETNIPKLNKYLKKIMELRNKREITKSQKEELIKLYLKRMESNIIYKLYCKLFESNKPLFSINKLFYEGTITESQKETLIKLLTEKIDS